MDNNNNNYRRRRGFFRHRYRKDRDRQQQEGQPQSPQMPEIICPVCKRSLREISSAIVYKPTGEPAHIECIISEIRKTEELQQNERICYLGKGSFGIISARNPGNSMKFSIRKRIQYEEVNIAPDWRKRLI